MYNPILQLFRCAMSAVCKLGLLHNSIYKKSKGFKSGDLGGHGTGPPLPIHRSPYRLFRYRLTLRWKCAGAPACINHICWCWCNGTSSSNLKDHSAENAGTALNLTCAVENVVQLDSHRVFLTRHWTWNIVDAVPASLHKDRLRPTRDSYEN